MVKGKNLSERLSAALEELKISQAELARKIQVKPQVINYLCKNKTKASSLTYEIADALGINGEWLATGEGYMKNDDDPQFKLFNIQNRIPIISAESIKKSSSPPFQLPDQNNPMEWVLSSSTCGKNGFAFRLTDKSMYPRFDEKTIVIINPDKKPESNDFVLAYIKPIDDVLLRKIELSEDKPLLKPFNTSMYKDINIDTNTKIIGTLVEARWQN